MINKTQLFIFLSLCLMGSARSFAKSSFHYVVRTPMSLDQLAKRHHKIKYLGIEDYKKFLKEWNPHIDDYESILPGTQIYLYNPVTPFLTGATYADKLKKGYKRESNYFTSMDFGLSLFRRQLTQTDPNLDLNLESTQNSPISADSSIFIAPSEKRYFYEINLKFSYLMASETNLVDDRLPNTFEYKIASNMHYRFADWKETSVNFGLAYQRMVAFNLSKLASTQNIDQHNYDIGYLTVGATYSYHGIWNIYSTIKFNYSKSVISTNDFDDQSVDADIVLLEHFFQIEKTRYYLFYEKENSTLSGLESELNRFGAGVRFLVF